jgi:hypothetical protein
VDEGEQPEVAAAAVMRTTSEIGALASLSHRHDSLDLGAALIGIALEA